MKKLLLFFSVVLLGLFSNLAQAQTMDSARSTQSGFFYYYPGSNVYSDQNSTDYWYYDSTASNWVEAKKLPSMYKINKQTKRNKVYYNGTDVWKDNAAHLKKYGTQTPMTPGQ